nr:thiamine phosphate synthase [Chloroherpeton thalassium]
MGEENCPTHALETVVYGAVKGGVSLVQLREKHASTRAFLEKAKALKALLMPFRVLLLINDRIDIALAANADGVHIGQSDMPYADARACSAQKKSSASRLKALKRLRLPSR